MRPMLAVSAGVTVLLLASGAGWAGGRNNRQGSVGTAESAKDKEPANFNKTFQWEEKVVGPKDKGVNHDRIAAMQEQGRREDAAKRREPAKKPARTEGVNGPASSTIPTQDIEKPAPAGSVRSPLRKASYTPPKQHDEIDNVLAENGVGSGSEGSADGSGRDGLGKVFGGGPSRASSPARAHRTTRHVKHHARARHRR
jgi:hypothetical protein